MQLSELFGTNAAIASGQLTIDLSELAIAHGYDGVIASITPSQVFALIIMQARANTADKTADPTYGATVEPGFDSLVTRGDSSHIATGFTVALYSPNPNAALDPDNVI